MKLLIEPTLLMYDPEELEKWKAGQRSECIDAYCRGLAGTSGFGEYIGGRFYESQGLEWIHHDFDIFGTNRSGKYPKADQILLKALGRQKLKSVRSLTCLCKEAGVRIETPDLLAFRHNGSEIRFGECKRTDTRDEVREPQARGLLLLRTLLGCQVDVFIINQMGTPIVGKDLDFQL